MFKPLAVSILAAGLNLAALSTAQAQGPGDGQGAGVATRTPVTFAADVFFDVDKSELKPAARQKLDLLVDQLKGVDVQTIYVIGHTDSKASASYNERLSAARSQAVQRYLIDKGLDAQRVQITGRGKAQPAADNRTREGRSHNRRVEIEAIGMRR